MGLKHPHINGKAADKLHAQFSYFLNSIPVLGTKNRNISQRHSLQKFPQHNAIEKIWTNEDRFRKNPRNQLIISTETNYIPRRPVQNLMTLPIIWTKFHTGRWKCHPPEEHCPTSCQIFHDWFLSTANVALTPALSTRLASTSVDEVSHHTTTAHTTVRTTPKMTNRLKAHHLHTLHAYASCTTSQYTKSN
jgi:hypothetical protein